MRLASIICVWSDVLELLPYCIASIKKVADEVIVVWSQSSNRGQKDDELLRYISMSHDYSIRWTQLEPSQGLKPRDNETRKRNHGLKYAYEIGCTHFIIMDGDEFYKPEELLQDKERFKNIDLNGMVHRLKVFIGKPTFCCDDHTLVPGIQKLNRDTEVGNFRKYPFAYDKAGNAHIDPTRRPSHTKGVIMSDYFMWHMSYVRRNIDMKIRNSTANLTNSTDAIYRDIKRAEAGRVSELYNKPLEEVPNYFNICI